MLNTFKKNIALIYLILITVLYLTIVLFSFYSSQVTIIHPMNQFEVGFPNEMTYYFILLFSIPALIHLINYFLNTKDISKFKKYLKFDTGFFGLSLFVSLLLGLKTFDELSVGLSSKPYTKQMYNVIEEYGNPAIEKSSELDFLIDPAYYAYIKVGVDRQKIGICKKTFTDLLEKKINQVKTTTGNVLNRVYIKTECEN